MQDDSSRMLIHYCEVVLDTVSQTVFGFPAGTERTTVFALATTGDSLVIVGTDNTNLTALDARNLTHLVWQISYIGGPQDLIVDSNRIYMPYAGTLLGAVSLSTRKFLWVFGPKFVPWRKNSLVRRRSTATAYI
jgi:hypothetical protein